MSTQPSPFHFGARKKLASGRGSRRPCRGRGCGGICSHKLSQREQSIHKVLERAQLACENRVCQLDYLPVGLSASWTICQLDSAELPAMNHSLAAHGALAPALG